MTAALCAGERGLSVVTLNMAKEPSAAKITAELRTVPALQSADVFLLQEVRPQATADEVAKALGLHAAGSDELAILSRYPLRDVRVRPLPQYDLVFHSRRRYVMSATAETPWGPVRLVNTHLDTRLNSADRLTQLGAAVESAAVTTIVGGDFNSNWFYWIGHVLPLPARSQARGVEEFMGRAGYRSAIPSAATTFDWLGQHLDWIWVRGMKTGESRVIPLAFSDHHACWSRVVL
jgi:endonuclease/exonuclease/phosphatase family metal-dependent hydrolase